MVLIDAHSRQEVIDEFEDARSHHALVAVRIAPNDCASWVVYLTHEGDIARLTFDPDHS
jgi:hypothetical protein